MKKSSKRLLSIILSFTMLSSLEGCVIKNDYENISVRKEFEDVIINDETTPEQLLDVIKDYTFVDDCLEEENISLENVSIHNLDDVVNCILIGLTKDSLSKENIYETEKLEIEDDFINISYKNTEEIKKKYNSFVYSDSEKEIIEKSFHIDGIDGKKIMKLATNENMSDQEIKEILSKALLSRMNFNNAKAKISIDSEKANIALKKKIIKIKANQ